MTGDDTGGRNSYMARLFSVLEAALETSGSTRPMTDLCERLGTPLSTTSRLVKFLINQGMLTTLPTGGYGPGPRMYHLALRTLDQLPEGARLDAATRELSVLTGESVSVGLVVSDRIVLMSRCEPDTSLRAVARVGDLISPHKSAMGKAILAASGPEERRRMITAFDPETDPDQVLEPLIDELELVRRSGHAVDEETFSPGLRCRAVTIAGTTGRPVGAISIAGPSARYTVDRAEASVAALKAEAAALSSVVVIH